MLKAIPHNSPFNKPGFLLFVDISVRYRERSDGPSSSRSPLRGRWATRSMQSPRAAPAGGSGPTHTGKLTAHSLSSPACRMETVKALHLQKGSFCSSTTRNWRGNGKTVGYVVFFGVYRQMEIHKIWQNDLMPQRTVETDVHLPAHCMLQWFSQSPALNSVENLWKGFENVSDLLPHMEIKWIRFFCCWSKEGHSDRKMKKSDRKK